MNSLIQNFEKLNIIQSQKKSLKNRGKIIADKDSFEYRVDYITIEGKTNWRCVVPGCKAKIWTQEDKPIINFKNAEHTHESNSGIREARESVAKAREHVK